MTDPTFRLEGVIRERDDSLADFEGPLSLILQLLSKNKIEIRDISVADILDQYLAYLDEMQRMDLEIASEFVQMAAYLLYIKTRTLLASDKEISELEQLVSSLEQLKEIAETKPGFIKAMWCGDQACEEKLKEVAGVSSRCMPFEQEHLSDTCVCCGKPAKAMVYWGKAY